RATWPSMEPVTATVNRAAMPLGAPDEMTADLFPNSISQMEGHDNGLQDVFDAAVALSKSFCVVPFSPSADATSLDICHSRAWPDSKPARFGLNRIGVDFTKYPDILDNRRFDAGLYDIYYAPDNIRELRTVILCTPDELQVGENGLAVAA